MNFPAPKVGEQVRRYIDERLRKFLLSERVVSGNGIIIKQTTGGKTISAVAQTWSDYVRVKGKKYTINGTRDRYIKVDITTDPPTVEWISYDIDPCPDGVEVYDTHVNEIHIPRLG